MREHLLGYVLGALEPDEQELVERRLAADPALRRELSVLERRVGSLRSLDETHDPPPGLASRTCSWIGTQASAKPGSVPSANLIASRADSSATESRRADRPHHKVTLAPANDPPVGRRWALADLLVAAAVILTAGILLLPAIAHSRHNARLLACQNNLRSVGTSLVSYANLSGGRFPQIPTSGKLSVAGYYGPVLYEGGFLDEPRWLLCPSAEQARHREEWKMATLGELEAASGPLLERLLERIGGSYAYNLGYMEDNEYVSPLNQGRANFALLSDAPCPDSKVRQSRHHGRCGQNVLFEDQSVRFLVGCTQSQLGDDIFQNRHGLVSAGVDPNDSVLGSSATSPLRNVSNPQ